jgi:integrase
VRREAHSSKQQDMDMDKRDHLRTRLYARLARDAPGINRRAVWGAVARFLSWRGAPPDDIPGSRDLRAHFDALVEEFGDRRAGHEFAWLQLGAAHIWGAERTAHFARVLRDARVAAKDAPADPWTHAEVALRALPAAWQPPLRAKLEDSRRGTDQSAWSAAYLTAVARALALWHAFCRERALDTTPRAATFDAFAAQTVADGASEATAGHYLARIEAAFSGVLSPGATSSACAFVVRDWRERGKRGGTPTKTGQQLVSASRLYTLGFELIDAARQRHARSMRAALDYRNGLLLAVAVAVPQRARALSVLDFGSTLVLPSDTHVRVTIPARALKMPERLKRTAEPFEHVLDAPALAEALAMYRTDVRPLFDVGTALFPSFHAPGNAITERHLGRLFGNVTERELGVRVPIHRVRDNVATELGEASPRGRHLAPAVLGHSCPETTAAHYDRADGARATRDFVHMVDARRSRPIDPAF